jgi:hypothetical protein
MGRSVESADFNHDGRVDFTEAHAYTLMHSQTIDVCVRTSDRFLRKYSSVNPSDARLVQPDKSYARLIALAGSTERTVLQSLCSELQLTGESRIAEAKRLSQDNERERRRLQKQVREAQNSVQRVREKISKEVLLQWPFLKEAWHPRTQEALAKGDAEMLRAVTKHPAYADWRAQRAKLADLKNKDLDLERTWAKLQRVQYIAESVALAKNLTIVAAEPIVRRYRALVALEKSSLVPGKSTVISQRGGE